MEIEGVYPERTWTDKGVTRVNMDFEWEMTYNFPEPDGCGPEGPAREEPRSGDLSSYIYLGHIM